jgi:hypothetical protein
MEKMFVRDLADSRQIRLDEWEKRPSSQRVREGFMYLSFQWL